jgi:23S rRNA pseudouridine2604 synthase
MEKVRVSKILSELGLCSRREADQHIQNGHVLVDGQVVNELGAKASRDQKITLNQAGLQKQTQKLTILLNKPVGYISHYDDEKKYKPALSLIDKENFYGEKNTFPTKFNLKGMAPAGRLDIDSTGLLILTQDGVIAKEIIGEQSQIEKEYLVRVEGSLSDDNLKLLNYGLSLDEKKLKPAKVFWQNKDQLSFTLTEGRYRQIRRMCELVGLKVVALKRVRIGQVRLKDLPLGQWRLKSDHEKF